MRIDSHQHFWNYDPAGYPWIDSPKAILRRSFLPADLEIVAEKNGVQGTVAVQARQSITETEWLLELAEVNPLVAGVVGWVPLMAREEELLPLLQRFSGREKLKGFRHVVQDEADDWFLCRRDFQRGVELLSSFGFVYDILVYPRQLPAVLKFVDRFPEQKFVLDHIAKPRIVQREFDRSWEVRLRELARRPHVDCKFSGLVTEVLDPQWSAETIRPYLDTAIEAFGSERLMFGSDWPVCLLRTAYDQWIAVLESLTAPWSREEQERFWGANARKTYSLANTD